MLRKLERRDFDRYVEFAYGLALDLTKSGYPTYADGIKTKEDFIAHALASFTSEDEDVLLYERDGEVCGWIQYCYLPEDHYLESTAFCVAEGMREALDEFIAFTREYFPGNDLYLGFPKENREAVTALEAFGFERIEESYNDVLDFEDYTEQNETADIISVSRDNFQLFSGLHSQHADLYWNSERILDAIGHWKIFVLLQGEKVAGAVYVRLWADNSLSEIHGVDFPDAVYDSEVYRDLLKAAQNDGKRRGIRHMIFFNDEESQADAIDCGFRCVGGYVCFRITL